MAVRSDRQNEKPVPGSTPSGLADFLPDPLFDSSKQLFTRAEDAQRVLDELQFIKAVVETMGDAMLWAAEEGRLIYTNEAAHTLLGYRRDEFKTMSVLDLVIDMDAATWSVWWRALRATRSARWDVPYRRKDGATLQIDSQIQIVEFGGSEVACAILRDLTEQKQATQTIQEQLAEILTYYDSASVGLAVLNTDLRYLRINRLFAAMNGITAEEHIGKTVAEVAPNLAGQARQLATAILATGEPISDIEIVGETLAEPGVLHTWREHWCPIKRGSTIIGFSVMAEDITERKQAAAERERLLADLAQAQKMEVVGRLAGGIAHDFNNMLAAMMLRTEMALEMAEAGTPLHSNLAAVYSTAQRSAALIKQLLGYARKQKIVPKVIDLNAAIAEMLPMLRRLIGEEVTLAWFPAAGLWPVKMDASQVDQIVTNLCVNGRDAIDGVGTVSVATANVTAHGSERTPEAATPVAGDYVTLTVTDTGGGMAPEVLARIFEPFYTTKEVGRGIGLGLAVVDGIVQQNGGQIEVTSRLGFGTTFTLYLPRHVAAVETPAALATAPRTQALLQPSRGRTVLVVEDEEIVLDMVAEVLRGAGYTVLAALRPSEAMRIAGEHAAPIDLLLTDVIMPEMNGAELASQIMQEWPTLSVIFMSGYPADHVLNRGALADDANFLGKPFTVQRLIDRVSAVLGRVV